MSYLQRMDASQRHTQGENNITVRRYECGNLHTFKTTEQITQILDATHMEQLKLIRIANLAKHSRNRKKASNA